eukprot:362785-Chlamydomonas_euryale.AAC.1
MRLRSLQVKRARGPGFEPPHGRRRVPCSSVGQSASLLFSFWYCEAVACRFGTQVSRIAQVPFLPLRAQQF